MLPSMNIKSKAENKSKIYQAHASKRKWLFPSDDRRFGGYYSRERKSEKEVEGWTVKQ
jgi:hypothetical protein